MIETTLNRIRAHSPCISGWQKLLKHLGKTCPDDEPLPLLTVLDSNGLDDALWCLRVEPQHSAIWRLLAVHYARQAQHLMTDPRSLATLDVAERYADGRATDAELRAARDAAWGAARDAAWGAARAAAWVAAWDAARAAGRDATGDAARAAAREVAGSAAAWHAGWTAAWDAAWDAARDEQARDLRTVLTHYHAEPGQMIHGWEGKA